MKPAEIEKKSFEIIEQELQECGIVVPEEVKLVVKRVIHTTADFSYAENLTFSENAIVSGIQALKEGADIVTDTNMGKAGINKSKLISVGGQAICFMADEDVAAEATRRGITRAAVSMEKAAAMEGETGKGLIYAIGNAPTALIRLYELIQEERIHPRLIIGVPVGFVNVVEAKELILRTEVPYIVARGRKGGSNVAAAICNALLYQL